MPVSSLSTHDKGLSVAVEPSPEIGALCPLLPPFSPHQCPMFFFWCLYLWLWVCDGNSPFVILVPQNNDRKHILICKSTWLFKLTLFSPSKITLHAQPKMQSPDYGLAIVSLLGVWSLTTLLKEIKKKAATLSPDSSHCFSVNTVHTTSHFILWVIYSSICFLEEVFLFITCQHEKH